MSGLDDIKNVAKEASTKAKEFAESEAVQTALGDAKEAGTNAANKAKEAGQTVVDKAKEIAESEQVQNALNTAKEKGSAAIEKASHKLEELTGKDLDGDGIVGEVKILPENDDDE